MKRRDRTVADDIDLLENRVEVRVGNPKIVRPWRPIIAERREAVGKIGDDNAPQTQGPEVDARRLPDVQAP